MAAALDNPILREHEREILRIEREEADRLFVVYEQARLELLGRLSEIPGDTFTAAQIRRSLADAEEVLRDLIESLVETKADRLPRQMKLGVRQVLQEIRFYEPGMRGKVLEIESRAVRKLATPRGLLLQQFERSMRTYGGQLVGDIQRRLAVHTIKRSTIPEMSRDIAGRLRKHAVQGARWRAERIVRTEVLDALGTARQQTLLETQPDFPDLKQQWLARIDSRTSAICTDLHGTVVPIGQPFPGGFYRPPAHPNCRSTTTAWMPGWDEITREVGVSAPEPKFVAA